jgi:hypothetical protein
MQITDATELISECVYQIYRDGNKDELAVFCHIGSTGLPIFHKLGEPSFQDVFALKQFGKTWTAEYVRHGDKDDLGYE